MRIQGCLFFIFLCSISIVISPHVVADYCSGDQQLLLLQLKSNLKFNPANSTKLVHWNQTGDCCLWNGVTCNEGRITGLDLSQEFISEGINDSSSLFNLQYLQSLNLAYNSFSTRIPTGFQKLTRLEHLNLSKAGFVGQVPIEISHLTSLVILDLSSSYWGIPDLELRIENPNLLMLIQNLTKITELYLDRVNISTHRNEWCHALSSSLPNLQVLSLGSCGLPGPIDSSLAKLRSLSIIRLNNNYLSSTVPEFFANFQNLTVLDLSYSGLRGRFPEKIFLLERLQFLDVSGNFDLNGSLPDFPKNSALQTLRLDRTKFSGPLPNSIGNLRHLSAFEVFSCEFYGTLPNSLSNLSQLVKLDLSNNRFTGSIPSNLSQLAELDLSHNRFTGSIPSFAGCKKLVTINLSYNNLTGEIPSTHFEGLLNLVTIDLENNFLSGKIPSILFLLPSVQEILLSSNKFEGQLEVIVSASSAVTKLLLSNNNLEGPIPSSVFEFKKLESLNLSSNKFSGSIELNKFGMLGNFYTLDLSYNNLSIILNKFPMLGNLDTIDLSYNNLSIIDVATQDSPFPALTSLSFASCNLIAFPAFLRKQSELIYLDLSNNRIGGTIPHWIWSLNSLAILRLSQNYLTDWNESIHINTSNLYFLDLHSNYLQGMLSVLPLKILYLDFSRNNISSVIPQNIGNYPSLLFLSLASNNIYGGIPESICNIPYLEVLDLSSNSLTGSIPKCLIANNGSIYVLDLGRNKLSGNIDTFPGSCNLTTLDLNGNLLEGKIPEYLGNCTTLEALDLGNNQINDKFPCWLKSIATLRVLVLRSNKLHGSIECPIPATEATWPHLQIVDFASNNFSGKIPLAFFETWKGMMDDENDVTQLEFSDGLDSYIGNVSYNDRVTVISKQMKMDLIKVLKVFTSVDFSCNKFEGPIPEELGQLKALHILNLSHNSFLGHIPSSFGNMKDLESLDLSSNSLSGRIPTQLASLSFLAFMNLSFNHLVGKIPTSTQIQSFEAASFQGNEGLCGPPLIKICSIDGMLLPTSKTPYADGGSLIDWNFLSSELGFTFGFGLVILPLMFWNRWKQWYSKRVDDLLYRIFPQLDFVYESHAGKKYRSLRWNPY